MNEDLVSKHDDIWQIIIKDADNNAQEAIDALDRIWNYCEEIDYSLPDNEKTGYKMLPDVTIIRNYLRSSITGE